MLKRVPFVAMLLSFILVSISAFAQEQTYSIVDTGQRSYDQEIVFFD